METVAAGESVVFSRLCQLLAQAAFLSSAGLGGRHPDCRRLHALATASRWCTKTAILQRVVGKRGYRSKRGRRRGRLDGREPGHDGVT